MNWHETEYDHLLTGIEQPDFAPRKMRRKKPVTIRGVRFFSFRRAYLEDRLELLMPRHWWEVEGLEFETLGDIAEKCFRADPLARYDP